jgi:hypothetical protein
MAVAIAADAQHPHANITQQSIWTEGGRQLATPSGTEQFHLHQPVLRCNETLSANQIRRVGRENVGNTQIIAQDRHGSGQADQLHVTIKLRIACRTGFEITANDSN